jgi:hypothetical protein
MAALGRRGEDCRRRLDNGHEDEDGSKLYHGYSPPCSIGSTRRYMVTEIREVKTAAAEPTHDKAMHPCPNRTHNKARSTNPRRCSLNGLIHTVGYLSTYVPTQPHSQERGNRGTPRTLRAPPPLQRARYRGPAPASISRRHIPLCA